MDHNLNFLWGTAVIFIQISQDNHVLCVHYLWPDNEELTNDLNDEEEDETEDGDPSFIHSFTDMNW